MSEVPARYAAANWKPKLPFATVTVDLLEANPALTAKGTIKGTVIEGDRPQAGLDVVLTDDKGAEKAKVKTKADGTFRALDAYVQHYPDGPHSREAKLLIEKIRQEEAARAALQKKAEEEALAKRQQEERIAAERREAEERARREAEAKRQAAAEAAKKKAEGEARIDAAEQQKIASLPLGLKVELPDRAANDPTALARSLQAELKRVGCDPGAGYVELPGTGSAAAVIGLGRHDRVRSSVHLLGPLVGDLPGGHRDHRGRRGIQPAR